MSGPEQFLNVAGHDAPAAAPLAHRVAAGAPVAAVARAVAGVWHDVDLGLRPVIGQRGVVALFVRCLHLTAPVHLWLDAATQDPAAALDLAALEALFARQSAAEATACGEALFEGFQQLLGSLIGPSLTGRLLRSAWSPPAAAPPNLDLPA